MTRVPAQEYAPIRKRTGLSSAWLVVLCVVVLAGLGFATLRWGVDYGERLELCQGCGARASVQHLRVLGCGGDYGRSIDEGPLSKTIQAWKGSPCRHQWVLYIGECGGVGNRIRISGEAIGRYSHVLLLETHACLTSVLNDIRERDPGLEAGLHQALGDSSSGSARFFESVERECEDREDGGKP